MSAIVRTVTDALQPNDKGWLTYTPHKDDTPKLCEMVAGKCEWEGRMERLKAAGVTLLAVGQALLLGVVAYVLGNVFAHIAAIFLLPLILIPPIYKLFCLLVGVGAGGLFANYSIPKMWNDTMARAHGHWDYSAHLDNQASTARIRQADLKLAT